MKKIISILVVLTVILLILTKSLYVEWTELFIIMGSLSTISVMFNLISKQQRSFRFILGSSAFIGFLFCWVYGFIDLTVDHFMYYLPSGNEDGQTLSLGFKIQEYSDDLFVGSVITMMSVMFVSFFSTTFLRNYAKS